MAGLFDNEKLINAVTDDIKKFNEIYAVLSVKLVSTEDEFRRNTKLGQASPWTRRLVDTWMTRNDTQNFIVLGDPAVKAKML